jgi:hypothetical protein
MDPEEAGFVRALVADIVMATDMKARAGLHCFAGFLDGVLSWVRGQ